MITIQQAVNNFKKLIEDSIKDNGIKGKEAIIRSSKPINNIHEAVKADFIRKGVSSNRINPPLGNTKPELKLAGFIKQKKQDVAIIPEQYNPKTETMKEGILKEATDYYGKDFTERIISVNIRSQMSSLAKNFDTLYERTIAEAMNLHVRCNKMVLGEVYMIPVKEYNVSVMDKNIVEFIDKIGAVEKYIKSFQAINNRIDFSRDEYKYEKVCLLLIDFSHNPPKIYNSNEELKNDGLLNENSSATIENLTWDRFTDDIINVYKERFGI